MEKKLRVDNFSKILLELIENGINEQNTICDFLGISADSFVTIQLHFLLKNDLIEELNWGPYRLTSRGSDFLLDKLQIEQLEVIDFEYYILENINSSKAEFKPVFFDIQLSIDAQLLEEETVIFHGYRIQNPTLLSKKGQALKISHNTKQTPSFAKLKKYQDDFAAFVNAQFKDKSFYEFDAPSIKTSQHFIGFLAFLYRPIGDSKTIKVAVRQHQSSVLLFTNHELEKQLSKKAAPYFQKYTAL